jgi:uncharacterized protein YyaL (SSP411 family)
MSQHVNRLNKESSPYLLQHAQNPVDWYPWAEEALQKAKAEDKPILVSIGYAACHWCHVMERESFEDESTAAIMNKHFINIKIDREERPDLDHIYMDAVQAMTGSGGWPLNVFLTPEGKPFFGGTYFPPVRAYNRASWKETLLGIAQSYQEKRHDIFDQAEQMVKHLEQANSFGLSQPSAFHIPFEEKFTRRHTEQILENILKAADREWGGFGRAPKFPQTFSIQYLLRHYHFYGDEQALSQAKISLDKMILGGIYDQAGGGFSRYSTDTEWLAPHFEKMTYDNALLVSVLSEAYQLTKDPLYAETIKHTLAFMIREMLDPEAGFYSALDADSEGVEGKFYTWTKAETDSVLGDDAGLLSEVFDISEAGNWEGVNILRLKKSISVVASEKGIPFDILNDTVNHAREKLLQARSARIRPQLDDKILLGWNALMNQALCKAFAALGDESYLQLAEQNMAFMTNKFHNVETGEWFHTYKNGEARFPAFLDDYAFLIDALLALQEVSGKSGYLKMAKDLAENVLNYFSEKDSPYFFYTPEGQADIIVRKKEIYDGAIPSGNALMAWNLYRLSILIDNPPWKEQSVSMLESLLQPVLRYPTSFGVWAGFLLELVNGTHEIVVLGENAFVEGRSLFAAFIPNKIVQIATRPDETQPLIRGKTLESGTTWYLCRNYACLRPVKTLPELMQLIEPWRKDNAKQHNN